MCIRDRFAESYLYDEEEAKDLVQDLFFYIWDHANTLQVATSLKAYLYTSLRNRCLNVLRDRKTVSYTHLFFHGSGEQW